MKSNLRDKAEGTFHEIKGKVKETVGKLTHNSGLEAKGIDEKVSGKTQRTVGQVKKLFGE